MDLDPDPWNWRVEDVQTFFRDQAAEYIRDLPHGRLPPLDLFMNILEENDVDGATLLTVLDSASLRDDCGIKSIGLRGAVMHCIVKLRRKSAAYQAEHGTHQQATPIPSIETGSTTPAANDTSVASRENVGEHIRAGEVQVVDAHGRKRRRLDVTKVAQTSESDPEPTPLHGQALRSSHGYFSDRAFTVDNMFFGQTDFGQEVGNLEPHDEVLVSHSDREAGLEDQNFQFSLHQKPAGEVRFVHERMRHFMTHQDHLALQRNGREALGVLPYRDSEGKDARSALVFQFAGKGDELIAIREDASQLDTGHAAHTGGEWSYLIPKHDTQEDEILPLYGESDDEEDDAATPSTAGEGEEEATEESEQLCLSADRVTEVMDQAIAGCIAAWHDDRLPALEKKRAWTVWKKMKKSRSVRDALIQGAQGRIEHFTTRLSKMKQQLMESPWQSDKDLLLSCGSLEPTIEDREEQRWMIEVWKRRQEPSHTTHHSDEKSARPTGPTPAKEGNGDTGFVVHPEDRLSLSPAPKATTESIREEIQYEADDEQFHTPGHSPKISGDGNDNNAADGSLDDFVVEPEDHNDNTMEKEPDIHTNSTPRPAVSDGKESSFSPDAEQADSDELLSASKLVKRKFTPAEKASTKSQVVPVDLTGLASESSTPTKTTPAKRGRPKSKPKAPTNDPFAATADEVDSWDFMDLANKGDRLPVLIVLLRQAGEESRGRLDALLRQLAPTNFSAELRRGCGELQDGPTLETSLGAQDAETIRHARSIYLRYLFPKHPAEDIERYAVANFETILPKMQIQVFTQMLQKCLAKNKSALFVDKKPSSSKSITKPGSSSVPIAISSDEELSKQETPHKKRKRDVARSAAAQKTRNMAQAREKKYNESQTTDSARLAAMIASDPSVSDIEINPIRDEDREPIYVSEKIARKMKAHQIEGVRFLWRELVAADEGAGRGCILAHTMGLGKTMQTIGLLVAVNETAQSRSPSTYRQLPKHLRPKGIRERHLRVLIMCPPSLIQNWRREMEHWAPEKLGNLFSLQSGESKVLQAEILEEWMRFGGVMLVGYQMFRSRSGMSKSNVNDPDGRDARMRNILLKETELVVADEAHHLKNDKSGIALAVSQIQTESRIGLTGTPMSNDVQEIYALVSFVSPGYLGEPKEFRAHYAEPIADGLYQESTAAERRKSIKKLQVLHAEIQPKVNRATIDVLRGSLKPKIEFLITVPLGVVQTELYKRCIKVLLGEDAAESASQVTIFGWLAVLTLLTNHPYCFHQKLLAHSSSQLDSGDTSRDRTHSPSEAEGASPVPQTAVDGEQPDDLLVDAPASKLGFSKDVVRAILDGFEEDMDPSLSAKATIFLHLLSFSLACGDKALVFSSSIPTLNFLERLLDQQGQRFGRIDGQTHIATRMKLIEDFHKHAFNTMLVSTRAGGVGLNIQGANRVFIFDFGFNPTTEEQAVGRAYRLGQTKPVYVYRFVAGGTFETNIYNKQIFKTSLASRVVDKKNPRRNAERNTRDYLYEPKEVPQRDLNAWAGKDTQVLDKLLAQHGPGEPGKIDTMIRAISTMETLHEEALDEPLDEEEQKEVRWEIEQGRNRPRNKKQLQATQAAQLAVAGSSITNGMAASQPSRASAAGSVEVARPPPSTIAAANSGPQEPFMGGRPAPKGQAARHE